jgi:spore germination protein KB
MAQVPEQGIINTKQYIWLLFITITSFTALQVPGLVIFQAGRDAWLSVLVAWLLDVLLAVVYAYLGIRFVGQNPVQYSRTILGKIFGTAVGLLFILFYLVVSASMMRGLAMYIGNVFILTTPLEVILLTAYLVVAYISRKGIEVIARMCEILGPLYLLSFIVLFLLALPYFHLEHLKPQFDQGIYPFLSGAPMILSFIGICISMGWYSAVCNRPENGFLAKFSAVSLGAVMVTLVIVLSTGIFGVTQAGNMVNPGLELVRFIHISDYFERMDIIWMVIAIGAGIMVAVNAIWIFSLGIAQIAGLDSYKPLVYPAAFLSFILSVTSFPNNTAYIYFVFYVFPIVGVFVESGLEMLLFFAAVITGKKGKTAS